MAGSRAWRLSEPAEFIDATRYEPAWQAEWPCTGNEAETGSGPGPFSVDEELESWATRLARQAGEAVGRAEPPAVRLLVAGGAQDEEWLTNVVFHARHRELGGRDVRVDQPELAAEWQAIREDEVRPELTGTDHLTSPPDKTRVTDEVVQRALRDKAALDRLVPRGQPPPRLCCVLFGHDFLDLTTLGTQGHPTAEPLGLLYTRKLGFIDMGHARETADVTLWALTQLRRSAQAGTDIQLFHGKARLTREISIFRLPAIAQQLAYVDSVEHEITTFGVPLPGGDNSSFSPEDLSSNLFGTLVAMTAFQQDGGSNTAITQQFARMLKAADAQSAAVARQVQAKAASRKWWNPSLGPRRWPFFPLLKRNFTADPWLIDEHGVARIGQSTAPALVSPDFDYTSAHNGLNNSQFAQRIASIRSAVPPSALVP